MLHHVVFAYYMTNYELGQPYIVQGPALEM